VDIAIQAPLEDVWRLTQSPDLHQRWDLRLTRITYLPRPDSAAAQRFLYHPSVDARGGLRLRSGEQRFYEGPVGFRFPLLFSGVADVHEWFDDATQRFGIEVVVTNRTRGRLFGYYGWFTAEWPPCPPDRSATRPPGPGRTA
jgi:hypothetical protein